MGHQDRATSVSYLDEHSDMMDTWVCKLGRKVLNKGKLPSASNSVWENAAPSAFDLVLNNLVSPYLSLAHFNVLS